MRVMLFGDLYQRYDHKRWPSGPASRTAVDRRGRKTWLVYIKPGPDKAISMDSEGPDYEDSARLGTPGLGVIWRTKAMFLVDAMGCGVEAHSPEEWVKEDAYLALPVLEAEAKAIASSAMCYRPLSVEQERARQLAVKYYRELNTKALVLCGMPYSDLTDAQQATVVDAVAQDYRFAVPRDNTLDLFAVDCTQG